MGKVAVLGTPRREKNSVSFEAKDFDASGNPVTFNLTFTALDPVELTEIKAYQKGLVTRYVTGGYPDPVNEDEWRDKPEVFLIINECDGSAKATKVDETILTCLSEMEWMQGIRRNYLDRDQSDPNGYTIFELFTMIGAYPAAWEVINAHYEEIRLGSWVKKAPKASVSLPQPEPQNSDAPTPA